MDKLFTHLNDIEPKLMMVFVFILVLVIIITFFISQGTEIPDIFADTLKVLTGFFVGGNFANRKNGVNNE